MFKNVRLSVILTPLIIFGALVIIGFIDSEAFIATLTDWFLILMVDVGWIIPFMVTAFIIMLLTLLFHPIGRIRVGGEKARPTMTYWQWFSVSLCAGIGTGIMFWGAVEPLLFTFEPAPGLGLEPGSSEAITWAMRTTFLHWAFTPYAGYMVFGVILAFVCYNLKLPYNVSSGFYLLMGKKAFNPGFSALVDTLTAFALVGGVAGSLGWGLLQLNIGIETVFGIEGTAFTTSIICAVIVFSYVSTSVSGLNKGIAWLGDKNAMIFIILLVYFFVMGPTSYICNLATQSVGEYINNFISDTFYTAPFEDGENWPQWWNMFWWIDFLSYGPLMGLFYARLSYGRTLRESVLMHWVAPAVFGIVWFSTFGGGVLHGQLFEGMDFYAMYKESGMEVLMLAAFDIVPLGSILKPFSLIVVGISFITLANAMTSTVASLSLKECHKADEAPASLKIMWGCLIGVASLMFTLTGGINGLKMVKTFAGFPIIVISLAMLAGFVKYFYTLSQKPAINLETFDYYQYYRDQEHGEVFVPGKETNECAAADLK